MGFTEILTIIFIVLKVFGVISWSWWLVLLPEIIALALYLIIFVVNILFIRKARKDMTRYFKNF